MMKKGSFSAMKSTNIKLILNTLHKCGSASRVQLAADTGLTAATVTNLTAELIKSGIIIETAYGESTGGRKPVMLKFNSKNYCISSAYISPNQIEFAIEDLDGNITYYNCFPITSDMDAYNAIDIIVKEYAKCSSASSKKIIAMGVALHGTVDHHTGSWTVAPNLNWHNIPVCDILGSKLNIHIFADNDVKLMAKGEMWYGAAKDVSDFAFMYVGDGIGGAVCIGGSVYRGASNASGEVGHCSVDINGEMCSCGNRGCLQTKANKGAMIKNARNMQLDVSCCEQIVQLALNGDKKAKDVISNEAMYLSLGVTMLINMYNPGIVIINSDIKDFDKVIISQITYNSENFKSANCQIKYSTLGDNAVIKGACAMVLKEIFDNPSEYFEK